MDRKDLPDNLWVAAHRTSAPFYLDVIVRAFGEWIGPQLHLDFVAIQPIWIDMIKPCVILAVCRANIDETDLKSGQLKRLQGDLLKLAWDVWRLSQSGQPVQGFVVTFSQKCKQRVDGWITDWCIPYVKTLFFELSDSEKKALQEEKRRNSRSNKSYLRGQEGARSNTASALIKEKTIQAIQEYFEAGAELRQAIPFKILFKYPFVGQLALDLPQDEEWELFQKRLGFKAESWKKIQNKILLVTHKIYTNPLKLTRGNTRVIRQPTASSLHLQLLRINWQRVLMAQAGTKPKAWILELNDLVKSEIQRMVVDYGMSVEVAKPPEPSQNDMVALRFEKSANTTGNTSSSKRSNPARKKPGGAKSVNRNPSTATVASDLATKLAKRFINKRFGENNLVTELDTKLTFTFAFQGTL